MKKIVENIFFAVLFVSVQNVVCAQSLVDTVPYCCDFENPAENLFWEFRNDVYNGWMIGNGTNHGGSNSLYMSAAGTYIVTYQPSIAYALRQIHIPAGVYEVTYDWIINDDGYARQYARAFLIPTTTSISGGSYIPGFSLVSLPSNAISLDADNALMDNPIWLNFRDPWVEVPVTGDYYIVFFWEHSITQQPIAVDNICITPISCASPRSLYKKNIGSDSIELNWTNFGHNVCGWEVEYGPSGMPQGSVTRAYTATKPYVIGGLSSDSVYEVRVRAICCDSLGTDTGAFSEPLKFTRCEEKDRCVDFADIRDPNVICSYGTYSQYNMYDPVGLNVGPNYHTGILDHGSGNYGTSSSSGSRHTVHTDRSETDPYTNGQLHTVPSNECASVRLGCMYGVYICQSISYEIYVDTNDFNMLSLNYACVMYNPVGHTYYTEPRFQMEILDSMGNLIDPVCGYININSSDAAVSWNQGSLPNVYWKDWTPLGVNIANYHGQNIRVRLTTFACGQGATSHFCYAYYTLDCQKAFLTSSVCGTDSLAAFIAPEGFNYRWFKAGDTNTTISTSRTLVTSVDSMVYCCELSVIGNPTCKFYLPVVATSRFPQAKFSVTTDSMRCPYEARVQNMSYISSDFGGADSIGRCEDFEWHWGDGTVEYVQNPAPHVYNASGTYTIVLVARIMSGFCPDTAYYTVTFLPPLEQTIHGDSVVCANTLAHIGVNEVDGNTYLWSDGQTVNPIEVYPSDSVTYSVTVTDSLGCRTELIFHVDVDTVPMPVLHPNVFESCVPYTLSLADLSQHATTNTYSWIWGDGSPSTHRNNSPTHIYREAGEFTMNCCIESAEGCRDTLDYQVYVYDFARSNFTWMPSVVMADSPTAHFRNLTQPHKPTNVYHWDFFNHEEYQASSDEENPSYTWTGARTDFLDNNLVRLVTSDYVPTHSGGTVLCIDTAEANVFILNNFIQFPNVVTANGDGINDIFEIKNLIECGAYTDTELNVYNHWGKLVYHVQNISTRDDFWNPAKNGDVTGTYYYRFTAKCYTGNIARNGVVQVLDE